MAFPGFPGGGAPFDFSSLQQALNDPAIKQMAEQIANDPSFQGLQQQLQSSMTGLMGGGESGGPAPDPSNFDPAQYMQAMSSMFQNQNFMKMAESLGQAIIKNDPQMQQMMASMQSAETKSKMEEAMAALKDDPELSKVFEELESAGPGAMMKYWNDPDVLSKLGKAMGGMFGALPEGEEGEEAEEAEEAAEEVANVHAAASDGNVEQLAQLITDGADVDEQDEEGRTALHFAAGYGEIACAEALISAGAALNLTDNNQNTALHYAAGYGQTESVRLLLDKGADKSAKNADGKTALEVATLNEQADVAALFSEE